VSQTWQMLVGDVREKLAELPAQSVQTCVTSPPYWGLRDYGTGKWQGGDQACDHRSPTMREGRNESRPKLAGSEATNAAQLLLAHRSACGRCGAVKVDAQIGLEPTPEEFVTALVDVFRSVRRVLKDDGTLWVNLGDSYLAQQGNGFNGQKRLDHANRNVKVKRPDGMKPKDLAGIPWMVAFALRADGWYLRSDIIWAKPNPMPESITDRPTKAHEYVFLLSKRPRYYYDAAAIRQPYAASTLTQFQTPYEGEGTKDYAAAGVQNPSDIKRRITDKQRGHGRRHAGFNDRWDAMPKEEQQATGANCRTVWNIATQPYPDAHFATFPEALPERCILAGSKAGDLVLDPFTGSGTTGAVALRLGRSFVGCELNPAYAELARTRIGGANPLFASEVA
jgi:DNA modification methylase